MALLHMDGFSNYTSIWQQRQATNSLSTPVPAIITSGGPFGEPYLDGNNGGSSQYILAWGDTGTTIARNKLFFQFHGRVAQPSGTQGFRILRLSDFPGEVLPHLEFNWIGGSTNGNINVTRGTNTQIALSVTDNVTDNTWHYYQIMVKIHDTQGDIKVIMDESTIIDSTGLDTRNGGTGNIGITAIQKVGSGSNARQFDMANLIVMSTEGSRLNGFIGERRIVGLLPNGGTTDSDWTRSSAGSTNWELVDTNPIDPTDFVQATSTGNTDGYNLPNLTVDPTTIDAVSVKAAMIMGDWGPSYSPKAFVQVSTDVDESTIFYPGGDVLIETHIVEDDPSGGTGWATAAIQNMTVGIKT